MVTKRFQIITTDENGGGNACEALWYAMAKSALNEGHEVEALLAKRSAMHPEVRKIENLGAKIHYRISEPKNSNPCLIAHKIWSRTGARWTHSRCLDQHADIRLFNVGTMVELAREPWASLIEPATMPTAAIIHSNSEIRCYPPKIERRLSKLMAQAMGVYFVSDRLRENAEQQLITRIPGAKVVRNPVNLTSTEIEPWPADDDELRIAVVGRLDAFVKGQVRLLHALSSECWKSRPWKLTIFGDGPDRAKIEKAVKFYGLTDHVEFGGFVKDVRGEIWRTHHALVMPSMLEGMPLTLVEAMVCGRPALCSDVGGAAELIRDGENGYLAGSPFASQLRQGLERLWQNRESLHKIGKQAHQDAIAFLPSDPGKTLLEMILVAIDRNKNLH